MAVAGAAGLHYPCRHMRTPSRRPLALLLLLSAALLHCAHRPPSPTDALQAAAARAAKPDADARTRAFAGFHALLLQRFYLFPR